MSDVVDPRIQARAERRTRWALAAASALGAIVVMYVLVVVIALAPQSQGPGPISRARWVAAVALPPLVVIVGVLLVGRVGRGRGWFVSLNPVGLTRRGRRALWAAARNGDALNERETVLALQLAAETSATRWVPPAFLVMAVLQLVQLLFGPVGIANRHGVIAMVSVVGFALSAVIVFRRRAQALRIIQRYPAPITGPVPR